MSSGSVESDLGAAGAGHAGVTNEEGDESGRVKTAREIAELVISEMSRRSSREKS
jgi:hypothetical protein